MAGPGRGRSGARRPLGNCGCTSRLFPVKTGLSARGGFFWVIFRLFVVPGEGAGGSRSAAGREGGLGKRRREPRSRSAPAGRAINAYQTIPVAHFGPAPDFFFFFFIWKGWDTVGTEVRALPASEPWSCFRRPRGDAVPQLGWPQPAAEWPRGERIWRRPGPLGAGHSRPPHLPPPFSVGKKPKTVEQRKSSFP